MNMETTIVKEKRKHFLVTSIDGSNIKVKTEYVEAITENLPEVEPKEVAILLATIKESGVSKSKKGANYKIGEGEIAKKAIVKLLKEYDVDSLNSIFEEMKSYEIVKILQTEYPIKLLREII